jgi:hypothetical protein
MPGHLKVGWQHLFDIPVLVRPLKFSSIVNHFTKVPIITPVMAAASWAGYHLVVRPLLSTLHRGTCEPTSVTVRSVAGFDERFDELWQAARRKFPIMGHRTSRYLNWRFIRHPFHSYHILVAEYGNRLLGYVVVRTGDLLGFQCGLIADLLVHPDFFGCVDVLLDAGLREFGSHERLEIAGAMMTRGGPYFDALLRHGFIPTWRNFWFILHPNRPDVPLDTLSVATNWYLTWADTDVV